LRDCASLAGDAPARRDPALFVALAIVHTWPLATDPAHLSRNDNGDTLLNEWALAWFAHQAPRAPLRLFEANIFYPEPHTLAYSEAMIVQSAMGAPLRWLGASPVLTFNLVLLAGFVLSGWAQSLSGKRRRWNARIGPFVRFHAHPRADTASADAALNFALAGGARHGCSPAGIRSHRLPVGSRSGAVVGLFACPCRTDGRAARPNGTRAAASSRSRRIRVSAAGLAFRPAPICRRIGS
jgi:hypothetical protein